MMVGRVSTCKRCVFRLGITLHVWFLFFLGGWLHGVDVCLCFCLFNGFVFFVVHLNVLEFLFFKYVLLIWGVVILSGVGRFRVACFDVHCLYVSRTSCDHILTQPWTRY